MKHRGLKFLSLLLTLVVLLGVLPGVTAWAEDPPTNGNCGANGDNVTWSYDTTTKILTISGTGAMADYANPTQVPWSGYSTSIQSVVINGGVTSIGRCAFYGISHMTSVSIPSSVTSIGDDAFSYCSDLTSVTIPNSVTTIGNGAFAATGLSSVTIPNSVTTIGASAFAVTSLLSVTIPNSVTTIGDGAFSACNSLISVTIGSGVTTIGGWAFGGSSLKSVTFVPGAAGNPVAIGDGAFDSTADTLAYGAGSTRLFEGNTEIEAGTARDKLIKLNDKTLTWKSTGYTVTYQPGEGASLKDGIQPPDGYTVDGQNIVKTGVNGEYQIEGLESCFNAPEGKVFDCWKDANGTEYRAPQKVNVTANLTLTAQWKDEEKPDGGEKKTGGSGSGFDLVFNIPGVDNTWEYVGGYAPQQAYRVSLAPMQGGSAALGLTTGESGAQMNVYPSTTVYVFPEAEQGYTLDKIVWSLIDGSASYDITEAKTFVMPAMDVVVYVTFRPVG